MMYFFNDQHIDAIDIEITIPSERYEKLKEISLKHNGITYPKRLIEEWVIEKLLEVDVKNV